MQNKGLVMATTLPPEATAWIIQRWQVEPRSVMIRTLDWTSSSLEQLLGTTNAENVNLISTSPPILLQYLQEHQKLVPSENTLPESQRSVLDSIRSTPVAAAISGFSPSINRSAPVTRHLSSPVDWEDLTLSKYQNALLISSPSRSNTSHLMVESLLQQKGWEAGWVTLLASAGNLVMISSRSFDVADKIKSGLSVAGPVIDNYASLLLNNLHLAFIYSLCSTVSPTYIAVLRNSQHPSEACRFIRYLLNPEGQRILADANTGGYPITQFAPGSPCATQQATLLNQPPFNYRLIPKRRQLVQRMFGAAISLRLAQLKDTWRVLYSAEAHLKRPPSEIGALLTSVPIDAKSNEDETWLVQFDNKSVTKQQMMEQQSWFLRNQRQTTLKLEKLK